MRSTLRLALAWLGLALLAAARAQAGSPLVLLTDFGSRDGAVSAMKDVV